MSRKFRLSSFAVAAGASMGLAAALTTTAFAAEASRPIHVRIKAEPSAPNARAAAAPQRQRDMAELKRVAPELQPLIAPGGVRSTDEEAALARHNLTRYYTIPARALQGRDATELVRALRGNPLVESAQIEPRAISHVKTPTSPARAASARGASIPDYTDCTGKNAKVCQNYMGPPDPTSRYWKLGGINAFEAQRMHAHLGDKVRIVSDESDHWDYDHIDLPKPFIEHWHAEPHRTGYHDTASAGIMFGKDNGFGVTGIAPAAEAGYSKYGAEGLVDLRKVLRAGDVLQVGVQYGVDKSYGCGPGAGDACYMPVEDSDLAFDAISYLTQEKGVHVILAAANGDADLDAPVHEGRYDRHKRDSGAIYVGAADPADGARAGFSQYGSRVDVFSWGWNVTTTDWEPGKHDLYSTDYAGTSSANPIIAGAVAWLQSLARERGYGEIPPKQMRKLLVDSGKPAPLAEPGKHIGTQPDLVRAAELLDQVGPGSPPVAKLTGPADATAGARVELSAEDSTGRDLTYTWSSQPALPLDKQGARASFVAPEQAKDTDYRITTKVVDGRGRESQAHHTVRVKAGGGVCLSTPAWDSKKTYATNREAVLYDGKLYRQNYWNVGARPDQNAAQYGQPWLLPEACDGAVGPVAKISGPSQAAAREVVKLSANESSGQDLKYTWTSLDGIALSANGAEASFKAPVLAQDKNLTFQLDLTDASGRQASASHVVKVKAEAPPEVVAPEAKVSGPATAEAGARVTLSGRNSLGGGLTYRWQVPDGIDASGLDQVDLDFVAPTREQDQDYRFTLTVSNAKGKAQATHVVTVKGRPGGGEAPAYRPGASYKAGDRVTNGGKIYACKPWPSEGWCSQSPAHYEPGKGSHWTDAWTIE